MIDNPFHQLMKDNVFEMRHCISVAEIVQFEELTETTAFFAWRGEALMVQPVYEQLHRFGFDVGDFFLGIDCGHIIVRSEAGAVAEVGHFKEEIFGACYRYGVPGTLDGDANHSLVVTAGN